MPDYRFTALNPVTIGHTILLKNSSTELLSRNFTRSLVKKKRGSMLLGPAAYLHVRYFGAGRELARLWRADLTIAL